MVIDGWPADMSTLRIEDSCSKASIHSVPVNKYTLYEGFNRRKSKITMLNEFLVSFRAYVLLSLMSLVFSNRGLIARLSLIVASQRF